MGPMTTNLKYFSGLVIIFSLVFFYYLFSALEAQSYSAIWQYAILYGVALFTSGFLLGYHDSVRNSRLDLGFQYHLLTFIIVNVMGGSFLFVNMGFNSESILGATLQNVFWGIGLLVHYYHSSRSIKGLDKREIFE